MEIQTRDREEQLNIETEILRYLWYESHATPMTLSGTLHRSLPILYDCLEDLIHRQCIFEFWPSPQGPDTSVYCLTRRAHRKLEEALRGYSRYKLKSFWDALKRERQLWTAHLQL